METSISVNASISTHSSGIIHFYPQTKVWTALLQYFLDFFIHGFSYDCFINNRGF